MMVNYSSNINKTNKHFSALRHEHKKPTTYDVEIHVLDWDRHKDVAGLYRLIGSQPIPLDNWIRMLNTYINK